MKKSTFGMHKAGHEKLVAALGEFDGDPYDAAVKRLDAPAPLPRALPTVTDLGKGRYEMPGGNKIRGADKVLEALGVLA